MKKKIEDLTLAERIKFHEKYLKSLTIKNTILCIAIFLILVGSGHFIPSCLAWKVETKQFENVYFYWDDDEPDKYDISLIELNEKNFAELKHYTYPVKNTKHIYSTEGDWTCFGTITTWYNAWGRQLDKSITEFYVNICDKEVEVDE